MIERVLFSAIFAFATAFATDSSAEPSAAWVQASTEANQKHRAGDYTGAEAALAPVIATVLQSDSNDRLSARMLAEYASIHQDPPGREFIPRAVCELNGISSRNRYDEDVGVMRIHART